MGRVNDMFVGVVEAVLQAQNKMEDNEAYTMLMHLLLTDMEKFWQDYSEVIPAEFRQLFGR